MTTLLKVRNNGQIALPPSLRHKTHFQEGATVKAILENDGSIRLIPVVDVDHSQDYFWSERWQAGERKVEENLQRGEYKDFDTIEDMLAELETE